MNKREKQLANKEKNVWWSSKTSSQKASFIASIVCFALFIGIIFIVIYSRDIFGDTIGDSVLGEGIKNGWDYLYNRMKSGLPVVIASIITVVIAFSLHFLANLIIFLVTNNGTRRSKTVGSLAKSLVRVVIFVVALAVILAIWGVDVSGIITSVGILTLIVGLGCQSLIQDIISGMFIVFDDYFGVGDIVIIDGFRGTIEDFGLKTTKIIDAGGNIKSISNSSITTVVNLSRIDSMTTVTIPISYKEDLVRVEAIIVNALEKIKNSIPNITNGPTYKGVSSLGESSVNLLILCYCKESDRFQVTRDLTRELYLLFKENDISIPFNQIVVNQPDADNGLKASDVQKLVSMKANNVNRGIDKEKNAAIKKSKKKEFKEAIEKSFGETIGDDR